MPHTCKACKNDVFSHDYCKYHQYMRKMKGGDLHNQVKKPRTGQQNDSVTLSPKKRYKIPKESKTRQIQGKTYKEVKDEIRAELKAQGKYNCFFCTKPMGAEMGFHHLKGRDGDNFIDKKYLVPGHNDCHVFKYHPSTVEQLLEFTWYQGFLSRLKSIDLSLYRDELKKQEKAGLLFG